MREGRIRTNLGIVAVLCVAGCQSAAPVKPTPSPKHPTGEVPPPPNCDALVANLSAEARFPKPELVYRSRWWNGFAIRCSDDVCEAVDEIVLGCVRTPRYASRGAVVPDGLMCCQNEVVPTESPPQGNYVPLPEPCMTLAAQWDTALDRLPVACQSHEKVVVARLASATLHFANGELETAIERFAAVREQTCAIRESGYWAWAGELTTSNLQRNVDRSVALVKGRSCATTPEQSEQEKLLTQPRVGMLFRRARREAHEAEDADSRQQRRVLLRTAAALFYLWAVDAPERPETPEALTESVRINMELGRDEQALAALEHLFPFLAADQTVTAFKRSGTKERWEERLRWALETLETYAQLLGKRRGVEKTRVVLRRICDSDFFCESVRLRAGMLAEEMGKVGSWSSGGRAASAR